MSRQVFCLLVAIFVALALDAFFWNVLVDLIQAA